MTAPANRATTIVGWLTAVVLCAVTTLVLLIFIDGYVLAMHHRLPPNGTFGFRDETTLSCLSAWYAGQKAGFAWFLFGGGPLLVFNIVFCVSAAMKRRSPSEVAAMSMVTLLLVGAARRLNLRVRLVHHHVNLIALGRRQLQHPSHPLKRPLANHRQKSITICKRGAAKTNHQTSDRGQ